MSQPESSPAVALQDLSNEPQEREVVSTLWGCHVPEDEVDLFPTPFYDAYRSDFRDRPSGVTFAEIKKAVVYIRAQSDKTLPDLVSEFPRNILPSEAIEKDIEKFIRFCILIWLRVDFNAQFFPNKVGRAAKTYWPKDRTLKEAISHLFPKTPLFAHAAYAAAYLEEAQLAAGPLQAQIPIIPFVPICSTADWEDAHWKPGNTIRRFVSCGYFAVKWTSRLQDHLLVEEHQEPPLIHLFHLASFLKTSQAASALFPEGLILETLCSMQLLLPREHHGNPTEKWFKKEEPRKRYDITTLDEHVIFQLDNELGLDLTKYKYWGPRLRRINQLFRESKPRSPLQLWRDDRDGPRTWTFAVAFSALILTTIFSLVQVVR